MGFKAEGVDWRPTSNARNLAMLEEVRRFSKQLKTLHRELRVLEDHVQGACDAAAYLIEVSLLSLCDGEEEWLQNFLLYL